jgi:hypothetical protein
MTNFWHKTFIGFCSALLLLSFSSAHALSVDLLPSNSTVILDDGQVTLELFADFTDDPTVGGSIDLTFGGPISFAGFAPTAYYDSLDPSFTGFGTSDVTGLFAADGDFLIVFGDFAGTTGGKLGDLTFNLLGEGQGTIALANNSQAGPFASATTFQEQAVALNGASFEIAVIPVPASVWLFGSALSLLAGVRRRLAA